MIPISFANIYFALLSAVKTSTTTSVFRATFSERNIRPEQDIKQDIDIEMLIILIANKYVVF